MKKIKIIVGAILRGALVIAPGIASGWWFWGKAPALIAILAAVGVEFLWLIVYAFFTVALQTWRNRKTENEQAEDCAE